MAKQTSSGSLSAEIGVIDKGMERVFRKQMAQAFLNSASSWLVGSESVPAGDLWPNALTLSLFCVFVCMTWVLSVVGTSVCDYFDLTISFGVRG